MEKNILAKRIQGDLKKAVKARDRARVGALRMLISALKNAELDEREELEEEKELAVLASYARRCKESIVEFERGGREDLVAKERNELDIVMSYLPDQLSEGEIKAESMKVIGELSATGPSDMGRVMGVMMKKFMGRVEGRTVNRIVADLLSKDRTEEK